MTSDGLGRVGRILSFAACALAFGCGNGSSAGGSHDHAPPVTPRLVGPIHAESVGLGSACAQGSDCTSGFCNGTTCALCITDANCPVGDYCKLGACATLIATGSFGCTTANDCAVGDRCDFLGFCRTCDTSSACNGGNSCAHSVCNSGGACAFSSNVNAGAACTPDATSCTSDTCNGSGACQHAPVADGTLCTGTTPAGTDTCQAGACADLVTVTLSVPNPLSPIAPVLTGASSVEASGGAKVISGAVVAMGNGGLETDPGATLQDAWIRGTAVLGLGTQVQGTLHAASVTQAPGVIVAARDNAPVFDPPSTLTWTVTYPTGPTADVHVSLGQSQALAPGLYGAVTVDANATLALSSGTYYLTDLTVAPLGGTITLDQTSGPVIVYVSHAVFIAGSFTTTSGAEPNLLIGYLGSLPFLVQSTFDGAIVAPSAQLQLLSPLGVNTGFFAARDMVLGPLAKVQYRAPSMLSAKPRLECITQPTTTEFRAVFGYENDFGANVTVPVGPQNGFTPAPTGRGQPTIFSAGVHRATFFVPFDGTNLTWTLDGQSVTASSSTPHCTGAEFPVTPQAANAPVDPDHASPPDPLFLANAPKAMAVTKTLAQVVPLVVVSGQTAQTGPVGVVFNGHKFIAYSGTDPHNNRPNVIEGGTTCPLTFGAPVILQSEAVLSGAGVGLTTFNGQLVLAWTGTDNKINIEFSDDGSMWTGKQTCGIATSDYAPSLATLGGRLVVAYTGIDDHLNVFSTDGGDCNDSTHLLSQSVLGDTSGHGPSLTTFGGDLYLGWTGQGDHAPNVAKLANFGASEALHFNFSPQASDNGTVLLGVPECLIVAYRGSGDQHVNYFAFSASDVASLPGGSGVPGFGPAPFITGDAIRTNSFPGLADFGTSIALLWTGTDSQVNFLENGVRGVYTEPVRMCVAWNAKFVDTGFGEPGAPAGPMVSQPVPASYANVNTLIGSTQQPVSVTLDKDGCFDVTAQYFDATGDPNPNLSTWKIQLISTFSRPDGVSWNVAAVPEASKTIASDGGVQDAGMAAKMANAVLGLYEIDGVGCEDVAPGGALLAEPADPSVTDVQDRDIMNVAAVTSRILNTPDLAISPTTPYWSFAGDVCPGATGDELAAGDSCYTGTIPDDAVFVGTSLPKALCPANHACPPDSEWKYIVAHETGHMVQAHSRPHTSLGPSYATPAVAPDVCQCKHVGTSNQLHCLQSVDDDPTAQTEGLAQFFSARIWNDPTSAACTFVDYKDFLRPDAVPCPTGRTCVEGPVSTMPDGGIAVTIPAGFHVEVPPVRIDCAQPIKWRNTQCTAGGDFSTYGTEYDWMDFLYNLNTVDSPTATRFAMSDINASYKATCDDAGACGEPITLPDGGTAIGEDYTSLLVGVETTFGPKDPRSTRFRVSAQTYGVDLHTSP